MTVSCQSAGVHGCVTFVSETETILSEGHRGRSGGGSRDRDKGPSQRHSPSTPSTLITDAEEDDVDTESAPIAPQPSRSPAPPPSTQTANFAVVSASGGTWPDEVRVYNQLHGVTVLFLFFLN